MENIAAPRPSACTFCNASVSPKVITVKKGNNMVTEAHYICSRCGNRFRIGILSSTEVKDE